MNHSNDGTGLTALPDLSVVVPAVNGLETLLAVLEALHLQVGAVSLDVIVPERNGERVRAAVAKRFPAVRILPVEKDTPIPTMRQHAFATATGRAVAVIEDHVIVPEDWAHALIEALDDGNRVVAGWVCNGATDRLVDRAAYLCEYGHMLVPIPSGPAEWLTGNNVAYDRELLREFWSVVEEGRWEDRLHAAIREAGIPLTLRSDILVEHKMHYESALEYAGQRFLYSRAFAGMRMREAGAARRIFYGVASLALPPILLARIVKNGWAAPEVRTDLLKSAPFLILFVLAWALGESVGAVVGPGHALGRVR